jgi:hypothetical protein
MTLFLTFIIIVTFFVLPSIKLFSSNIQIKLPFIMVLHSGLLSLKLTDIPLWDPVFNLMNEQIKTYSGWQVMAAFVFTIGALISWQFNYSNLTLASQLFVLKLSILLSSKMVARKQL